MYGILHEWLFNRQQALFGAIEGCQPTIVEVFVDLGSKQGS